MRRAIAAVAMATALAAPAASWGWEAMTTSAGILEQSALASGLHRKLSEQLGSDAGLYARLRVPRADAEPLFAILDKLNPIHGYAPGPQGRQLALGWLTAGAAIADSPPAFAANHFYDPRTGRGLRGDPGLRHRLRSAQVREKLIRGGDPAPKWVMAEDNPLGVNGFHDQYRKAVSSRSPAERERHIAGALLAAGAIVHALVDLASPSHVRDDLGAHLEPLSEDRTDVGSRFERVTALAHGRLGVPRAAEIPTFPKLEDYFFSLARTIEPTYFSAGTLPAPVTVEPRESAASLGRKVQRALRRPQPAPGPLDLAAARSSDGARLENADGVCLAHYRIAGDQLRWSIPDECALEQIGAILPIAAAFGAGALEHLFRGSLTLEGGDQLTVKPAGVALAKGTLTAYWDDQLGVRTEYARVEVAGSADQAVAARLAAPPAGARRVAVLFTGHDAAGQPLSAAAVSDWPIQTEAEKRRPTPQAQPEPQPEAEAEAEAEPEPPPAQPQPQPTTPAPTKDSGE
jgi:hypothetical protein